MDFSFSFDENRILLLLTQSGYWSLETFNRFEEEFLALHADIRSRHGHYRALSDCTDFSVQSNEVSQAFEILFANLMNENRGRYAIIVGSALNKMQARRVLPQPHVKMFTDIEPAMTWLFESDSLPETKIS